MIDRHQSLLRASVLAIAALIFTKAEVDAQSTRYHPVIRPASHATTMPASAFAHSAFGQIARIGNGGFMLRLRSGRLLTVDATEAINAGRTSEPLFVGKLVVVTGGVDSRGTFDAQTVTRMSNLDSATRADH